MTTSDRHTHDPTTVYVWIWLPAATEPVVCGRLDDVDGRLWFTYAQSYRNRPDAVSVFTPELPLDVVGPQVSADGERLPLCIDDAMPDSWGRRLVNYRLGAGFAELSELTYLLASGSDRIGALDFQASSTEYVPRDGDAPALTDLADAARRIEAGEPLDDRLADALLHGTSIGGARPKALLQLGERSVIAKFSSTTDTYPVVQGEFLAMTLAQRCGLSVAEVELVEVHRRAALLVERFDRPGEARRLRVVSALTVLGLNAFPSGRYASYSYTAFADAIRRSFTDPDATLAELFGRIAFNILCGNTDDHGRNHAVLVHEDGLRLSPAYDVCPQLRSGGHANQAMAYSATGERVARLAPLVAAAATYHLDIDDAQGIVDRQVSAIRDGWEESCEAARLTAQQRSAFLGGQFLNPSVFELP
jgi:serine/threonine-protein kinase HipA